MSRMKNVSLGRGVGYLTLYFVNIVLATLLRSFGDSFARSFRWFAPACKDVDSPDCYGNQAVYRFSFALTTFFFTMILLSLCAEKGHRGWWCLKVPYYGFLLLLSFLTSNEFFDSYVGVAKIASGAFILVQVIVLIDCTYGIHEYMLNRIDLGEKEDARQALLILDSEERSTRLFSTSSIWKGMYLLCGFGLLTGSIMGILYLYTIYGECQISNTFITITLVSVILITLSSVFLDVGLLPPTLVSGYIVFLSWQSLSSYPDKECNPYADSTQSHNTIVSSVLLAAFTLTWMSWTASSSAHSIFNMNFEVQEDGSEEDKQVMKDLLTSDVSTTNEGASENYVRRSTPSWQFYAIMMLASLHMAMALTNWGASNGKSPHDARTQGLWSVWVKIVSQWITILLYLWSVWAPLLLPDRQFGRSY